MIRAGGRERLFLEEGWSDLVVTGNVTARFSTKPDASVRLPLPELRRYTLLLRIDPLHYPEAPRQRVHVSLNGELVSVLDLGWNPERVGEYPLVLPAASVQRGPNTLTLRTERMVPMKREGRAFPEVPRDHEVGPRLWYKVIAPA
jgi:hypothetical protein